MPLIDIEIARQAKMQPIETVAAKIGINRDQLYICASTSLYRIRLDTRGVQLP
jgi:formyltetrahydrofolate synthetase